MIITLVFSVVLIISFFHSSEETVYHLDTVDWLPDSASDISFHKRGGFGWLKVYNCKMKKSDFMRFADKNKWDLREEKAERIFRQYVISKEDIVINHSLVYINTHNNNGGTSVMYDIENERLYVSQSHR